MFNRRWLTEEGKTLELVKGKPFICSGCEFEYNKEHCPRDIDHDLHCSNDQIWKEVKVFNGVSKEDLNNVGVKFDTDKRQWWFAWQFLPELEQVVDILAYGNKKYPADDGKNWSRVDQPERRYSSALMRHLSLYLQGEKYDPETGKSHLAHMITNALFLMWFDRKSSNKSLE